VDHIHHAAIAVHVECHVGPLALGLHFVTTAGASRHGMSGAGEFMSPTTVTEKAKEKPGEKGGSDRPVEIPTREQLIAQLNEDLSREYQAVIAYVNYSQTLKGAAYMAIARELEQHAAQELSHAITIAKQIDYLGGTPTTQPKPVRMSDKATEMLQFDLENE